MNFSQNCQHGFCKICCKKFGTKFPVEKQRVLLNKKQRAAAPSLAQQPAVLLCKIFAFVTQLHNHADKLKNKVCCNSGAQTADRMTDDSFSCHMRTVQGRHHADMCA